MNARHASQGLLAGILAAALGILSACGRGGGQGPPAPAIPAAPVGVVAVGGDTQILIAWNDSPGATSYIVYRATVSGGPYSVLASGVTTNTYTNTGLANGTPYYFIVTAVNSLGESAPSAEVWAAGASFTAAPGMSAVAAGTSHSLSLKASDGTVWAWGRNNQGQLGNGSRENTNAPFMVAGLTGMTAIAGGTDHSLALKSDGTVWAWGSNDFGQLGNGTFLRSTVPVQVLGLPPPVPGLVVTAIAAGKAHSLARISDGTVWAWGDNSSGQLGNGTFVSYSIPFPVTGLTGMMMTKVAAGTAHSLALRSDGAVWAWGDNTNGQLGDTTFTTRFAPVAVWLPAGSVMTAISSRRRHSMALRDDGTLYAWGDNATGQLAANPLMLWSSVPISVAGFTAAAPATAIGAGAGHSLAVRGGASPGVLGWGDNETGQLGDGTTVNQFSPVPVTALTGTFTMISGGRTHSLALKNDGTVWSWGANTLGQLGTGVPGYYTSPGAVPGTNTYTAVAARGLNSLALKNDGTVWSWGRNTQGQLGVGDYLHRNTPIQISGLTAVTAIEVGGVGAFGIALRMNGEVWTWGDNTRGQLGNGTNNSSNVPVRVLTGLTNALAIAGGGDHCLALDNSGTLYAWGENKSGQLGNGTTITSTVPVAVMGLTGVVRMSGGSQHSLAVKSDGTVWAWGDNTFGQLGNGTFVSSSIPVQVLGITGATAVSSRERSNSALLTDGTVLAWGDNDDGQLGNGTRIGSSVPSPVLGLSTVKAISAGGAHGLAILTDGTLWAWGNNSSAQLGDGTTTDRLLPVQVQGLTGIILTRIAGGGLHNLVLDNIGTLWAWGDNTFGQLGNGTFGYSSTPVSVP